MLAEMLVNNYGDICSLAKYYTNIGFPVIRSSPGTYFRNMVGIPQARNIILWLHLTPTSMRFASFSIQNYFELREISP